MNEGEFSKFARSIFQLQDKMNSRPSMAIDVKDYKWVSIEHLKMARRDLESRLEKERLDVHKRHIPGTMVDNTYVILSITNQWIEDWFGDK